MHGSSVAAPKPHLRATGTPLLIAKYNLSSAVSSGEDAVVDRDWQSRRDHQNSSFPKGKLRRASIIATTSISNRTIVALQKTDCCIPGWTDQRYVVYYMEPFRPTITARPPVCQRPSAFPGEFLVRERPGHCVKSGQIRYHCHDRSPSHRHDKDEAVTRSPTVPPRPHLKDGEPPKEASHHRLQG